MTTHQSIRRLSRIAALVGLAFVAGTVAAADGKAELQALPEAKAGNADMVELGKHLFFDTRLSGDMGVSCASCHDPAKGFSDGMPLSAGYPSVEYFRNAPTLINSRFKNVFMWDGRLDGADMGTLVRDMLTEAHTMNMDSRLMQERLSQVPEYVAMWQKFRKDDINGMRVYGVVGEYVKTLVSQNAPIDRFLKGDGSALTSQQKDGYEIFTGKGGCVACHNGPLGSDGQVHNTGVPENPEVLKNPNRTVTLLRHYATSGMPNYMNARTDLGHYAISKDPADMNKFATPSLRELKYTAPYMHNGMLTTLDQVVDFYNQGGGQGSELTPLGLSGSEKKALVAFLEALSGEPLNVVAPTLPDYQPRQFGKN
ncbi:cytochrome c peroxidase [Denitromonas iodatirespirans]|uniref:Cytochrome-c peroxidase IdrP2 n=1 Tax=Denitromonas iodatirespirans TaxID=2795389 RepID=IDRP2_DENI1|nr:cytochrome c peroxidase [Denitromonas iodatirespirans]P0DV69.1 RecName: Full=Cytochrome-c peroxidase IdrP2; AltName: Full=Iodate reductase subunit IdrP2; Flags: Precursor [Denitromonas iodatirespirans]MBT0960287.1 iodate reductase cytochrome c peroxidase IdrP2 [Denitromonas iodatirespirans]